MKPTLVRHRMSNPELLHKKDRGRPTEALLTMQRRQYGEQEVMEAVPGAEVVRLEETDEQQQKAKEEEEKEEEEEDEEDEEDDSDWEQVVHSSDEEEEPEARISHIRAQLRVVQIYNVPVLKINLPAIGVR
jgi:protein SDA1